MLTYTQARSFMDECARFGSVPGLENIKNLCAVLGNPQSRLRTIHIAGTNGKGSVGAYLASILEKSALRVGRYTSPAVMCAREVFSVNGEPVSEDVYAMAVSRAYDGVRTMTERGLAHPTQFEIETAAAFECFNEQKCDVALIEVGMGGRLDSTNVIEKPLLSVITRISMDHTAFLGDTLEKITEEKAGIIKRGVPVVSAEQALISRQVLENKCRLECAPLYFADETQLIGANFDGIDFSCGGYRLHTSMCGAYQCDNAALAVKCALVLRENGVDITDEAISGGIAAAAWSGRFEVLRRNPPFIIDGAHNPDGAERLAQSIKMYFGEKKPCFIFGVFRDKDYKKIAALTAHLSSRVYTVTPPSPRGLDAAVLCETVKKYNSECTACGSVRDAVRLAAESADGAVCFGSLSFLAEVKKLIEGGELS